MKSLLLALSMAIATAGLGLAPLDAQAKRLGAGRPAGMQRQMPAKPADATPAKPAQPGQNAAAPAAAPTPAPAAAPGKRSWMGPLAGLAAGLGIAALFSHFGMGAGLSNFVMMALLAVVAVVAVRWLIGRFAGGAQRGGPAMAGAGYGSTVSPGPSWAPAPAAPAPLQRDMLAAPAATASTGTALSPVTPLAPATLPGGMARDDFLRLAKMVFIRLQAANDAANVDDLRKFTTPELFASLKLDLQERGSAKNQTDVVTLEAEVAEVAREGDQDVVSVRFHGLIREAAEAPAEPFDELWHLVRAAAGGDWAIAGITPLTAPA